jgi:hypothetical protein
MQKIVIEVGINTAKKWEESDSETKQRISNAFDQFLNVLLEKEDEDFWPLLEKIRNEAEKKSFSDEILNQILNEK